MTVAQSGAMSFELGVDANRRESLGQGSAEHGVGDQFIARSQASGHCWFDGW